MVKINDVRELTDEMNDIAHKSLGALAQTIRKHHPDIAPDTLPSIILGTFMESLQAIDRAFESSGMPGAEKYFEMIKENLVGMAEVMDKRIKYHKERNV